MLRNLLLIGISALSLTAACDILLGGAGSSSEPESAPPACLAAERCCAELEQVQVYDNVSARSDRSNFWPNHCPSWKVQSASRCQELIDHVATLNTELVKNHPVYDPEFCQFKH